MKLSMSLSLLSLGVLVALGGCSSDPLPGGTGDIVTVRPGPEPLKVAPFGLEVGDLLLFNADQMASYEIKAWAPGLSLVTVSGLPEGAAFLPAENRVVWAPSQQAAQDPQDPAAKFRMYKVHFEVSGTGSADAFIEKDVFFSARQSNQALQLQLAPAAFPGWEVKALQGAAMSFTYQDNPGNALPTATLWTEGLPAKANLTASVTAAGMGMLVYTPPSDHVGYTRVVPTVVTLTGVDGQISQVSFLLQVSE